MEWEIAIRYSEELLDSAFDYGNRQITLYSAAIVESDWEIRNAVIRVIWNVPV